MAIKLSRSVDEARKIAAENVLAQLGGSAGIAVEGNQPSSS